MSWRSIDIASLLMTLESGSRPKGGVSTDRGDVPSLGGENVLATGGVTLDSVNLVSTGFYSRMTKGHLQDSDVLINKDGAQTGKVGLYRSPDNGPACINEHLFLLRGMPEKLTQEYLYYTLLSDAGQRQIRAEISGSAQPGLKSGFVKKVSLSLPVDIREQSKITEILATVDQAIEQTEALIAKQQRIKTGLMQDLLTRGIDEHGNLRSEATHQFKNTPLGEIPVEWDVASLGSVSRFVTSGARGWAKYYGEEGSIFIRIGNLTRDHINLRMDDIVYVRPPQLAEGLRTRVHTGDLLISVTADLGIIGVIPEVFQEAYVNQHVSLVRLNADEVNSRFVGWFLSSYLGRAQFDRLNESGAKAGLNLQTVRSLLCVKPSLAEQNWIAAMLDRCLQTLDHHVCALRKLRQIKTGLIQDLLTGNRRVIALLKSTPEETAS